jgi:hypothetical protein
MHYGLNIFSWPQALDLSKSVELVTLFTCIPEIKVTIKNNELAESDSK